MRKILFAALLLSTPANAAIYPWTTTSSGHIDGVITGVERVTVVVLSYTTGIARSPFGYSLDVTSINSLYDNGQLFKIDSYGETFYSSGVQIDPTLPLYSVNFSFSGGSIQIEDDARTLVQAHDPQDSHSAQGGASGSVILGLSLPDQLSLTGVQPIAGAVPETSTWAMLLIGFAGIGAMAYRRS